MKSYLVSTLLLLSISSMAQWDVNQTDPVPLAAGNAIESNVEFSSDEQGNTYYCWTDFRNGKGELFVQKLDRLGKEVWTKNGVSVGSVVDAVNYALTIRSISPLSNGGAIVAWHRITNVNNPREKEIHYNIIAKDGSLVLPVSAQIQPAGFVYNANVTQGFLALSEVEPNLIRLVYNTGINNGSQNGIYAYDIDAKGQEISPPRFVTETSQEGSLALFDTQNDRLVLLSNVGAGNYTLSAYDNNLSSVAENTDFLKNPFAGESRFDDFYIQDGKVLIGRTLTGNGQLKVIAQCLDKDLKNLWGEGGVVLGSGSGYDIHPSLNKDGGGSVAWIEPNISNSIMSAARFDDKGNILWEKPVFDSKAGVNYFTPNKFASDGENGFYNLWFTPKNGGFDLSIQHVDDDGAQSYGPSGLSITDFNWFGTFRLLPHVSGGVIALYSGTKNADINANDTYDLYTNLINKDGGFGIEQGFDVRMNEFLFCPGSTINPSLSEGVYTGNLLSEEGQFFGTLTPTGSYDTFVLPSDLAEGDYRVQFVNEAGLSSNTLPIFIQIPSTPIASASVETICKGESEAITLEASCEKGNLLWSTDERTPSIEVLPDASTTYTVACNLSGCPNQGILEIPITVIELNVSASAPDVNYAGQDVRMSASGGTNYNWTGPNGFVSSVANAVIPSAFTSDSGEYVVKISDENGCEGEASVQVNITQLLSAYEEDISMVIYPNPSQSKLRFKSDIVAQAVEIISSTGERRILRFVNNEINIETLIPGKYTLLLKSEDKLLRKGFVKY